MGDETVCLSPSCSGWGHELPWLTKRWGVRSSFKSRPSMSPDVRTGSGPTTETCAPLMPPTCGNCCAMDYSVTQSAKVTFLATCSGLDAETLEQPVPPSPPSLAPLTLPAGQRPTPQATGTHQRPYAMPCARARQPRLSASPRARSQAFPEHYGRRT
jgi:hypothetical protein